jgi:hypothetical protein
VVEIKYFTECLIQDITLELEVLGWGLVLFSKLVFIIIGVLLSLVCFVTVQTIVVSSQVKWISAGCLGLLAKTKTKITHFVTLRTQNFFKQEVGVIGIARRIIKIKHNHIY